MIANQARAPKQFKQGNGSRQPDRSVRGDERPSFSQAAPVQPQPMNRFSPREPHQPPPNNNVPRRSPADDFKSWRSPRDSEPNRQNFPVTRPFNTGNRETWDQRQPRPAETKPGHHTNGSQVRPRPPQVLNPNVGQCNRCTRHAELKCQRCGDFYCSYACQKVDWPKHKRHCFPMPELVPADKPVNGTSQPAVVAVKPVTSPPKENGSHVKSPPPKMDLTPNFNLPLTTPKPIMSRPQPERLIVYCDDDPKSGDIVAITWPCSTNRVYIVQNEGKMGEEYREMLNWASRPENHGPPFEESPEKGTLVFAEWENDWYRAIVQKVIDSDHVLVAFFDFGNAEQVHFSKLRQYTGDEDPVRYTYNVYLKDCPYNVGDPFPANVSEYLKKLSDQFTPLRLRYTGVFDRTTNVELFVAETDVCVNDKICALLGTTRAEYRKNYAEAYHKAVKQAQPDTSDQIFFDDLQCERMDTENKTRVIVLCSDGLESNSIWCCLEAANTSIKEIDDAVNAFASDEENLTVVVPE